MSTTVAGWHAVEARLAAGGVLSIHLDAGRQDRRAQRVRDLARHAQVELVECSGAELDVLADGVRHQGVVAVFAAPVAASVDEALAGVGCPLVLILDGVEDPRNLGACLRSADGAGAHCVIVPRRRAAGLTEVARKTAAGAADSVPLITVSNLVRCMDDLKQRGLWLIGLADTHGASLYQADLRRPAALVLGNEGQGLRRLTAEHCDELVSLPMRGAVSSLNVSVATGIALYEAGRQRTMGVE